MLWQVDPANPVPLFEQVAACVRRGLVSGSLDAGSRLPSAKEVAGMKLKTPLGVDGTITMRDTDHTIINYPVAWGKTVPKAPWVVDFVDTEWAKILEIEQQWKKEKGWA